MASEFQRSRVRRYVTLDTKVHKEMKKWIKEKIEKGEEDNDEEE
jgi:hypothetical protein